MDSDIRELVATAKRDVEQREGFTISSSAEDVLVGQTPRDVIAQLDDERVRNRVRESAADAFRAAREHQVESFWKSQPLRHWQAPDELHGEIGHKSLSAADMMSIVLPWPWGTG